MQKTAVVIVTHNSEKELDSCLKGLAGQNVIPDRIYIVDSGSEHPGYLQRSTKYANVTLLRQEENIGFSRSNNIGYDAIPDDIDFVLFLNPDTLLDSSFLAKAEKSIEQEPKVGILTGRLLGYDFAQQKPTERIDSTGVFRNWYGRWFDRGQGETDRGQFSNAEMVPAACGALMFCRRKILEEVLLPGKAVFDPDFFLYKEDIELCLRVRKAGWYIRYDPGLIAYHGRGWKKERRMMSRSARLHAARNEVQLYRKHPSPYMFWALLKYLLVAVLDA